MNSKKLAQNIKKLRKSHSLTQQEVAKLLCICQSAYSRLERGDTSLDYERLVALVAIFKTSVEKMESFEEERSQAIGYQTNMGLTDTERAVHEACIQEIKASYEARLKDKDEQIVYLKKQLENK